MQRSRQEGRSDDRGAPARLQKGQPVIPANLFFHANVPVELQQIGAAAQQHMLAVVDDFAGAGMLVGRRSAAKERARFKKGHAKAAVSQRASASQAR